MQEVVANVDHIKFSMEVAIENQLGVLPLPFTGMDKSGAPVCHFFKLKKCLRGANCPFRHIQGDRATVCKHWLRGLCKKGDQCEFLHEYDMSKMPECYFYQKFGRCDNKDCQYQHIDPADKVKDCPWYDKGFCKHGPLCKYRHRRRIMCPNYLVGFCPEGPGCKFAHPRWEIPGESIRLSKCRNCMELGQKCNLCMQENEDLLENLQPTKPLQSNVKKLVDQIFEQRKREQSMGLLGQGRNDKIRNTPRDMSRITCFKVFQIFI